MTEDLLDHSVPADLLELYEVLEWFGEIEPSPVPVFSRITAVLRPLAVANPIHFVSRSEWKARAPRSTTKLSTARGNTLHWEGPEMGLFPHTSCATKVRGIQAFHMDSRGWNDIAYSSMICPHGYIFEGRWYGNRTAAQGTNEGNDQSYAHCYLGGVQDPFPIEAKAGIVAVFDHFEHRGSGTKTWGHRDWHSTVCPGPEEYAWITAGMPLGPPIPPTPPNPTPSEEDDVFDYRIVTIPTPEKVGTSLRQITSVDSAGKFLGVFNKDVVATIKANDNGVPVPASVQVFAYQGMLVLSFIGLTGVPVPTGNVGIVLSHPKRE